MKGSSGSGLGLGSLGNLRGSNAPRAASRPPATPRAVEVLTAQPILCEEQISSLDGFSRDAGWAQHQDIDYEYVLNASTTHRDHIRLNIIIILNKYNYFIVTLLYCVLA